MKDIHLFLDDRHLNVRQNVNRITHQAKKLVTELYMVIFYLSKREYSVQFIVT